MNLHDLLEFCELHNYYAEKAAIAHLRSLASKDLKIRGIWQDFAKGYASQARLSRFALIEIDQLLRHHFGD